MTPSDRGGDAPMAVFCTMTLKSLRGESSAGNGCDLGVELRFVRVL